VGISEPVPVVTEIEPPEIVTQTVPPQDPCASIIRQYSSWPPEDLNLRGEEEYNKSSFRTAICWFELALSRLESTGRVEEPLVLTVLENLSRSWEALGKTEKAAAYSNRASNLRERLKM
jgi:hypothetical protein